MEFRKCSIFGEMYGEGLFKTSNEGAVQQEKEKFFAHLQHLQQSMTEEMNRIFKNPYRSTKNSFVDPKILIHLQEHSQRALKIREFFVLLALCHTVLVERPKPDNQDHLVYKAQSPDEEALVSIARDMGFVFLDKLKNVLTVNILGKKEQYKVLNILEFNSARKRMSVLIETKDGTILLMCKGADNVIYERLAKSSENHLSSITLKHLEAFASEGLRTLCVASRVVRSSVAIVATSLNVLFRSIGKSMNYGMKSIKQPT
jgi:phospholipid-translocating ATPase